MAEGIRIEINPDAFDKAVHGGLPDGKPVLKEGCDIAFFIKPGATKGGKPGAVITFTVMLPDGSIARAQAVTTVALLDSVGAIIRGWLDGGHI